METFDYDNTYLVPRPSDVNSREEVDLQVRLREGFSLEIPIIASPMKGITGSAIISGMSNLGGIGIIHRFQTEKEMQHNIHDALRFMAGTPYFGVAIGLDGKDERYKYALDSGANIICVDVANGYLSSVGKFCERLATYIDTYLYDCLIMSGNVVTASGAKALRNCGVDLIRVGIGTGNLCTTRQVTGIGFGQITAIQSCADERGDAFIVADGSIKNSGDAVKALAAGADLVMMGSLFARTMESENNGTIYGMASKHLQDDFYHTMKRKSIEGTEKEVKKDILLADFIDEFVWGIKSAFTYMNARNIKELRENAEFVEIK